MVRNTRHRDTRGRAKGIMGRVSVLSTLARKYADCRHRSTSDRKNGNRCKYVRCRAGWAVWGRDPKTVSPWQAFCRCSPVAPLPLVLNANLSAEALRHPGSEPCAGQRPKNGQLLRGLVESHYRI